MNREQKLEEALKTISASIEFWRGSELGNLKVIVDEALTPEFLPKEGSLYMVKFSGGDEFPYKWSNESNSELLTSIRELTDQEWLDLGSPQLHNKD